MDFDAVAEGVVYEKALPGRRATVVDRYSGCIQPVAKAGDVGAFEAEVAIGVCAGAGFLNR
jgi:hypothetical protein